jgi:hypothetical protein
MHERDFINMIERSYTFNRDRFNADGRWRILNELYTRNFLNNQGQKDNLIPRKIHQIWLGGVIPDVYKRYADTWPRFNPNWEYRLWGDNDIPNMNMPNMELFNSLTEYGSKSDLVRYHVLNEYGGLYVDTDFECLKPFDELGYLEFYTSIGYHANIELYPGLIACTPHHPVTEKIRELVCDIHHIPKNANEVLETTSSYFFTRAFWQVIKGYMEGVVAFPPEYFYPFPNEKGHRGRNGMDYIKDFSYAVHHWAVSWVK